MTIIMQHIVTKSEAIFKGEELLVGMSLFLTKCKFNAVEEVLKKS